MSLDLMRDKLARLQASGHADCKSFRVRNGLVFRPVPHYRIQAIE